MAWPFGTPAYTFVKEFICTKTTLAPGEVLVHKMVHKIKATNVDHYPRAVLPLYPKATPKSRSSTLVVKLVRTQNMEKY